MSELFFTSDQHFGHNSILKFCNRPFADTVEMQEQMIARFNAKVPKGARVYFLGDVFWRTTKEADALAILGRLNGQHYYILGNHEEMLERSEAVRAHFVWVKERAGLSSRDGVHPRIVLDHYAGRVWDGSHRGSWQLYGHSHAALPESASLSFDIGVDAWNFEPVSIEEVAEKMKVKQAEIDGAALLEQFKEGASVRTKYAYSAYGRGDDSPSGGCL